MPGEADNENMRAPLIGYEHCYALQTPTIGPSATAGCVQVNNPNSQIIVVNIKFIYKTGPLAGQTFNNLYQIAAHGIAFVGCTVVAVPGDGNETLDYEIASFHHWVPGH
jgi:hypothetical protein